ncbi:hypothetical protein [Aquirufa beregesia]|nr:hypothetical protein [Aquirufa beregesia]
MRVGVKNIGDSGENHISLELDDKKEVFLFLFFSKKENPSEMMKQ